MEIGQFFQRPKDRRVSLVLPAFRVYLVSIVPFFLLFKFFRKSWLSWKSGLARPNWTNRGFRQTGTRWTAREDRPSRAFRLSRRTRRMCEFILNGPIHSKFNEFPHFFRIIVHRPELPQAIDQFSHFSYF